MGIIKVAVFWIFFIGSISTEMLVEHANITTTGVSVTIEAEQMITMGNTVHGRSQASNRETVYLHQGNTIHFEFCLMADTLVDMVDVGYSNDGGSDAIEVAIDNDVLGEFQTSVYSGGGTGWDHFRQSGNLFSTKAVAEGRHRLSLFVKSSDQYGVEVDYLRLTVNYTVGVASFMCNVFCFDDITCADNMPDVGTSAVPGKAVQRSVHTQCAEEDNIHIPVFHRTATKYVISASLPKYTSFSNNRGADWTRCQMVTAFWNFSDVRITDNLHAQSSSAQMNISVIPISMALDASSEVATVSVHFDLEGPIAGSTDSEIGTNVFLKDIRHFGDLSITFQYYGRNRIWSSPVGVKLGKDDHEAQFATPDFAFSEGGTNKIRIQLFSNQAPMNSTQIGGIYMFKRKMVYDAVKGMYNDGVTIIEAIHMDMWWRINETMDITTTNNGQTFPNVHYIRIYERVPWTDNGFSQVFVLYQDGNIRLLPLTPHGLDWIPFGSSVLIGQSDPSAKRPCAPIRNIEINPNTLDLKIFYMDGGTISLQIKASLLETQLVISEATYTRDLNTFPFFTFRSMWVADGNSDVDHISADGNKTFGILGPWASLRGSFFAFYRKCISRHNTLSPDIRLKIIS